MACRRSYRSSAVLFALCFPAEATLNDLNGVEHFELDKIHQKEDLIWPRT